MSEHEEDVAPVVPAPDGNPDAEGITKADPHAFSRLERRLTPEELASSGVHKMLLLDWDTNQALKKEFGALTTKYHEVKEGLAVMTAERKPKSALQFSQDMMLALGGVMAGYAPSIGKAGAPWTTDAVIAFWLGIGFIIAAGITKHLESKNA